MSSFIVLSNVTLCICGAALWSFLSLQCVVSLLTMIYAHFLGWWVETWTHYVACWTIQWNTHLDETLVIFLQFHCFVGVNVSHAIHPLSRSVGRNRWAFYNLTERFYIVVIVVIVDIVLFLLTVCQISGTESQWQ